MIRSCVGGNGVDDDVSWLCKVHLAPVLMCLDIGDSGVDSEMPGDDDGGVDFCYFVQVDILL